MRKKKNTWGGRRKGAGRPRSKSPRINRVVVMLSDKELKDLTRRAKREKLPVGTAAYKIVARSLSR